MNIPEMVIVQMFCEVCIFWGLFVFFIKKNLINIKDAILNIINSILQFCDLTSMSVRTDVKQNLSQMLTKFPFIRSSLI